MATPFRSMPKEMKNVKVAFKILDDDEVIAVGYRAQLIPCHLIFDVKMDFTRKVPRRPSAQVLRHQEKAWCENCSIMLAALK
jgi:hypothetical protein